MSISARVGLLRCFNELRAFESELASEYSTQWCWGSKRIMADG